MNLDESQFIFPIKSKTDYFQVLIDHFELKRNENAKGVEIKLKFTNDNYYIGNFSGKKQLWDMVRNADEKSKNLFQTKVNDFFSDTELLHMPFDVSKFPLRYANGGVLPIITIGNKNYFCLFHRERYPIGWNIANGSSDTIDEVLNPEKTILREFGEEFFMANPNKRILHYFDPNVGHISSGTQQLAINLWEQNVDCKFYTYKKVPIRVRLIDGFDSITIKYETQEISSYGHFLSITPEDSAIEIDKLAFIEADEDSIFFDGEIFREKLLNRAIGLFDVNRMKKNLKNNHFVPDILFHSGERQETIDIEGIIQLEEKQLKRHDLTDELALFQKTDQQFDLCPITRSIIEHYFNWVDYSDDQTRQIEKTQPRLSKLDSYNDIQVFISYNSDAKNLASALYNCLKHDYTVFYSTETLKKLGDSHYFKVIRHAVQAAHCMVVVGTIPEHFESRWVDWEWGNFEILRMSGIKPDNKLFVFTKDLHPSHLPLGLNSVQVIRHGNLDEVKTFVDNAFRGK